MNPVAERGFSLTKFLLIFLVIIVLITGALFGIYFFNKQSQINEATSTVSDLVSQIQAENTDETFKLFSDKLKGSDSSSAYYTWLFWSSGFKESSITIQQPATSIEYTNSSILATSANNATVTFKFTTDKNSVIYIQLIHSDGSWKIGDYGTVS